MAILAKVESFFQGKKTYIIAILIGVGALLRLKGYVIPEWVWVLLASLGLGAIRSAIGELKG